MDQQEIKPEIVDKQRKNNLGGITGKGFMPGQSGNPAGRPKGTISPITKVKQFFEEDPEGFDEWIKEYIKDPNNRKHIVEMIDGKPKQPIEGNLNVNSVIEIFKNASTEPDKGGDTESPGKDKE